MTGLAPNAILESPPAVIEALIKIVNQRQAHASREEPDRGSN